MNLEENAKSQAPNKLPTRVLAFIDGFNLYHALDKFSSGATDAEKLRFRKYKWLCLTSLVKRFIAPNTEKLVGVEYFTTFPTWNEAKRLRHQTYVSAQKKMGVHINFGDFKKKMVECRAYCYKEFESYEEKQTDVNIAVAMMEMANRYDKLILVTADSDQAPALRLVKKIHPQKTLAVLPPIGRQANELSRECAETFKMTEQHLIECQLPNPFVLTHNGKQYGTLDKPFTWE
jgi:uncharacterized LabA/DUF88 family protein